MSWRELADGLDSSTFTAISDWVKIGAGSVTIGGLLWACAYVARLIWQTQTVVQKNVIEDNKRLREELDAKVAAHRTEMENKDLLITGRDELIGHLRKVIAKRDDQIELLREQKRKSDDEMDTVEDDNRELRFENARLRDQGKGTS